MQTKRRSSWVRVTTWPEIRIDMSKFNRPVRAKLTIEGFTGNLHEAESPAVIVHHEIRIDINVFNRFVLAKSVGER